MAFPVFLAVLAAAALHAGWNALIKFRLDPFLAMTLICVACGAIALPALLVTGLPRLAAWPWVAASVMIHLGVITYSCPKLTDGRIWGRSIRSRAAPRR